MGVSCVVITEPYEHGTLVRRALAEASQEKWLIIYFLSLSQVQTMVEDLGNQGWLGAETLRSLYDSLTEGYRSLANEVLLNAVQQFRTAGLTADTLIIEGDVNDLKHFLEEKCGRLYTDDVELLRLVRHKENS